MKTTTITINNFKGCRLAKLELPGLTVLSGTGYAGKTSIGKAAAILACQVPKFRGSKETLAYRGGKNSKIEIESPDYSCWVKYPAGELSSSGAPISDMYTSGLVNFLEENTDTRRKFLQEITKSIPEKKDLRLGLSDMIPDAAIDELWEKISVHGFDAVLDQVNEKGRELKYEWKRITGQQFPTRGTKAAEEWLRNYKSFSEPKDMTEEVEKLNAEKNDLIKNDAISESEAAKIKSEIENLPKYEEELALTEKALKESESAIVAAGEKLKTYKKIECANCGHGNYVDLPKEMTDSLVQLHNKKIAVEKDKNDLSSKIKNCKKLSEIKINIGDNSEKISGIESKIDDIVTMQQNKKRHHDAVGIFSALAKNLEVQEALKPGGVRNTCLMRGMEMLRDMLAFVSKEVGIDKISIDDDMVFSIGNRTEYDLSTSETWLLRHCIQLTFAMLKETPQIIFLDEVGGLYDSVRIGLIKYCNEMKKSGHKIIMAITHYNRARCETLIKAGHLPGFGASHYWIGD